MQKGRRIFFLLWLSLCFCSTHILSQQVQLPSLLGSEDENNYTKNSVLQPGENPQTKIRNLIFIKTSISKKNCYVGEPILVTYQLYTAISCHSRVTKQVSFTGCSVIEMTSGDEPEQVQKEGEKIYRVQLIRRVQLIPLQAGELIIPPATVSNDVAFSTLDNPYLEKTYSADVSSEPYSVQVGALPDKQPDNFSGITGKFTIAAKTDSTTIAAGENNRLQITIQGSGNIAAVTEPKINWPKHTEHFDAQDSQHINRGNFPESGDKTFIIPFISTKTGKITIPEISFSYFNTDAKKFETITTESIPLMITTAVKTKNPTTIMSDSSNDKYLWLVPSIAMVVIVVWLLTSKNGKKGTINKPLVVKEEPTQIIVKEAEPIRPNYELLLIALNVAEDNRSFFTNAKTLLISALQFHLSPKQDDEVILLNLLVNKDETLAKGANHILSVCNKGLYSPVEDEATRTEIIEKLSTFINALDKT